MNKIKQLQTCQMSTLEVNEERSSSSGSVPVVCNEVERAVVCGERDSPPTNFRQSGPDRVEPKTDGAEDARKPSSGSEREKKWRRARTKKTSAFRRKINSTARKRKHDLVQGRLECSGSSINYSSPVNRAGSTMSSDYFRKMNFMRTCKAIMQNILSKICADDRPDEVISRWETHTKQRRSLRKVPACTICGTSANQFQNSGCEEFHSDCPTTVFWCLYCGDRKPSRESMIHHISYNHRDVEMTGICQGRSYMELKLNVIKITKKLNDNQLRGKILKRTISWILLHQKCPVCRQNLSCNKRAVLSHMLDYHHSKQMHLFTCVVCDKLEVNFDRMLSHIMLHHPDECDSLIKCSVESESLPMSQIMSIPQCKLPKLGKTVIFHDIYKCLACKIDFITEEEIVKHCFSVHSSRPHEDNNWMIVNIRTNMSDTTILGCICPKCYFSCQSLGEINKHLQLMHGSLDHCKWNCSVCNMESSCMSKLSEHFESAECRQKSGFVISTVRDRDETEDKTDHSYSSQITGFASVLKREHSRSPASSVTTATPVKLVKMESMNEQSFRAVTERDSEESMGFQVPGCMIGKDRVSTVFAGNANEKRHREKSPASSHYQPLAKKVKSTRSSERDDRDHCVNEEKATTIFACSLCGFKTYGRGDLSIHSETVHSTISINQSGPLCCYRCPFRCETIVELFEHEMCHTNFTPYRCSVCRKMFFSRRVSLDHLDEHCYKLLKHSNMQWADKYVSSGNTFTVNLELDCYDLKELNCVKFELDRLGEENFRLSDDKLMGLAIEAITAKCGGCLLVPALIRQSVLALSKVKSVDDDVAANEADESVRQSRRSKSRKVAYGDKSDDDPMSKSKKDCRASQSRCRQLKHRAIRTPRPVPAVSVIPHACDQCGYRFMGSRRLFETHTDDHHCPKIPDDPPKRRYMCFRCPHSILNTAELRRHEFRHLTAGPYFCTLCTQHFPTETDCVKHLTREHQCEDPQSKIEFYIPSNQLQLLRSFALEKRAIQSPRFRSGPAKKTPFNLFVEKFLEEEKVRKNKSTSELHRLPDELFRETNTDTVDHINQHAATERLPCISLQLNGKGSNIITKNSQSKPSKRSNQTIVGDIILVNNPVPTKQFSSNPMKAEMARRNRGIGDSQSPVNKRWNKTTVDDISLVNDPASTKQLSSNSMKAEMARRNRSTEDFQSPVNKRLNKTTVDDISLVNDPASTKQLSSNPMKAAMARRHRITGDSQSPVNKRSNKTILDNISSVDNPVPTEQLSSKPMKAEITRRNRSIDDSQSRVNKRPNKTIVDNISLVNDQASTKQLSSKPMKAEMARRNRSIGDSQLPVNKPSNKTIVDKISLVNDPLPTKQLSSSPITADMARRNRSIGDSQSPEIKRSTKTISDIISLVNHPVPTKPLSSNPMKAEMERRNRGIGDSQSPVNKRSNKTIVDNISFVDDPVSTKQLSSNPMKAEMSRRNRSMGDSQSSENNRSNKTIVDDISLVNDPMTTKQLSSCPLEAEMARMNRSIGDSQSRVNQRSNKTIVDDINHVNHPVPTKQLSSSPVRAEMARRSRGIGDSQSPVNKRSNKTIVDDISRGNHLLHTKQLSSNLVKAEMARRNRRIDDSQSPENKLSNKTTVDDISYVDDPVSTKQLGSNIVKAEMARRNRSSDNSQSPGNKLSNKTIVDDISLVNNPVPLKQLSSYSMEAEMARMNRSIGDSQSRVNQRSNKTIVDDISLVDHPVPTKQLSSGPVRAEMSRRNRGIGDSQSPVSKRSNKTIVDNISLVNDTVSTKQLNSNIVKVEMARRNRSIDDSQSPVNKLFNKTIVDDIIHVDNPVSTKQLSSGPVKAEMARRNRSIDDSQSPVNKLSNKTIVDEISHADNPVPTKRLPGRPRGSTKRPKGQMVPSNDHVGTTVNATSCSSRRMDNCTATDAVMEDAVSTKRSDARLTKVRKSKLSNLRIKHTSPTHNNSMPVQPDRSTAHKKHDDFRTQQLTDNCVSTKTSIGSSDVEQNDDGNCGGYAILQATRSRQSKLAEMRNGDLQSLNHLNVSQFLSSSRNRRRYRRQTVNGTTPSTDTVDSAEQVVDDHARTDTEPASKNRNDTTVEVEKNHSNMTVATEPLIPRTEDHHDTEGEDNCDLICSQCTLPRVPGTRRSLDSLITHAQYCHSQFRPFQCLSCSYTAVSKDDVTLHSIQKHGCTGVRQVASDQLIVAMKKFLKNRFLVKPTAPPKTEKHETSSTAREVFTVGLSSTSPLAEVIVECSPLAFVCQRCCLSFASAGRLIEHLQLARHNISCLLCDKGGLRFAAFARHWYRLHQQESSRVDTTCPICRSNIVDTSPYEHMIHYHYVQLESRSETDFLQLIDSIQLLRATDAASIYRDLTNVSLIDKTYYEEGDCVQGLLTLFKDCTGVVGGVVSPSILSGIERLRAEISFCPICFVSRHQNCACERRGFQTSDGNITQGGFDTLKFNILSMWKSMKKSTDMIVGN